MQREYVITRHGRDFVMYAGLLDAAHRDGLAAIRTSLVQAPTPANGFVAICHAEVTTSRGTFAALGDADPENAPRPLANALVRLAETRAKARALADAVNVAMTAIEDLADSLVEAPPATVAPRSPAGRAVPLPEVGDGMDVGGGDAILPRASDGASSRSAPVAGLRPRPAPDGGPRADAAPEPHAPVRPDRDAPDPSARASRDGRTLAPAARIARAGSAPSVDPAAPSRATPRPAAVGALTGGLPATAKQVDVIVRLARDLDRTVQVEGLTRVAASELISELSGVRFPAARRDPSGDRE